MIMEKNQIISDIHRHQHHSAVWGCIFAWGLWGAGGVVSDLYTGLCLGGLYLGGAAISRGGVKERLFR